jgi:arginyl-tRNA synthetase
MEQQTLEPLYLFAAREILKALEALGLKGVSVEKLAGEFATPPKVELGHLAFPCFQYAKLLGKKPPELAQELASLLVDSFAKAQVAGPYLNLFLSHKQLGDFVVSPLLEGSSLKKPALSMAPILIEYSQPNTHKELHVGHMRNLCLGNALVRILRYTGRPVVANTYPGDVGTHVAKCLWYMKYHNQQAPPAVGKGEWLGKMYSLAHNKLEDERGTPNEEINRQQLTAILKELEQKKGPFFELWKETREWSIDLMKALYNWADVHFDVWYWESQVDSASVQSALKLYEQGLLTKSEGAIGLDLESEGLGFCLLVKTDGNGLYATKDVELARKKFATYHPSRSIYVVDMRQELHFKQVFAVLKKIGFAEAEKCFHLKYNFVELPDGPMSSRKGNIVPIMDLIHKMRDHVKLNYLERYKNEWSVDEIEKTADMVAHGAIKYGMNVMDPNKKIIFKMEDWLRLDGESGPYIQYTYARIQSLVQKIPVNLDSVDYSGLTNSIETELILKLAQFNKTAEGCAQNLKTSTLCTYLYETAKLFNSFYHDCPIGKLDDKNLQKARLALAKSTGELLKKGLELLGIPAPQKM